VDELYVLARSVLLDALEALGPHREACVLAGAQAIYLRVGEADLAVAPFTTDGDLVVDPRRLSDAPPVERGLTGAGFALKGGASVGIWVTRRTTGANVDIDVEVDLLVPESVALTPGRRAARLPGHEPHAARTARGLEGALFDADLMRVAELEETSGRGFDLRVAGPAALLISKLHKISDRSGTARASDKDAYDVLRLMRGTATEDMVGRLQRLRAEPLSAVVTEEALTMLGDLFGRANGVGSQMAVRTGRGLADPWEIAASCAALATDVLVALRG